MAEVFKISDSENETIASNSQLFIIKIHEKHMNYCKVNIVVQQSPMIYFTVELRAILHNGQRFLRCKIESLENESNKEFVATIYMMHLENRNASSGTYFSNILKTYCGFYDSSSDVSKHFNDLLCPNSFLLENNLYMYCKVVMKNNLPVKSNVSVNIQPSNFLTLYEKKVLTDINVICKDQEFSAHKAILSCQSTVFQAMFESQMKESRENNLEINDFEPEIVELMIRFMYSNEIETNLSTETWKQLYMIANKYDLQSLKNICMQEICKPLKSMSEVMDVMLFAGAYNFTEFKDVVIKFIIDNRKELL